MLRDVEMDLFAQLLSQLAAEHHRLRQENEGLRADAEAWRAERTGCYASPRVADPTAGAEAALFHIDWSLWDAEASSQLPRLSRQEAADPVIARRSTRHSTSGSQSSADGHTSAQVVEAARTRPFLGNDLDEMSARATSQPRTSRLASKSSAASASNSSASEKLPSEEKPSSKSDRSPKKAAASENPNESRAAACGPLLTRQTTPSASAKPTQKRCPSRFSTRRPRDCNMWPLWVVKEGDDRAVRAIKLLAATSPKSSGLVKLGSNSKQFHHVAKSDSCLQPLVVAPRSMPRVAWDALCLMVLIYDILSVPVVAFMLGEDDNDLLDWSASVNMVTTAFWTVDILFSFFSGFHSDGKLEMRPSRIAARYLRSWFLVDFPVVVLDWCASALLSGHFSQVVGVLRVNKVVRVVRVLRVFRLLRMAKLPRWADSIFDRLRSETVITVMGVLRSLLTISVASHYIACLWYYIGEHLGKPPFTWVQALNEEDRDLAYRYFTALHWSVTQFTPASMEISPRSTPERGFAIVVILSAMVAFSCFVSSITQAMANLQRLHAERDKQRAAMRRFFAENRISLKLGGHISRFARTQNILARRRVQEHEVQAFQLLPESLRQELNWEVYSQVLALHPLFASALDDMYEGFVQDVCRTAMSETSLARYEELFHPGQEAHLVYFTRSGAWEYRRHWQDEQSMKITGERCLCEVALWLQWELQGVLAASTPCEAACLDARRFHEIVTVRPDLLRALREYAGAYKAHVELEADSAVAEVGVLPDLLRGFTDLMVSNSSTTRSTNVVQRTRGLRDYLPRLG